MILGSFGRALGETSEARVGFNSNAEPALRMALPHNGCIIF